MAYGGPVSGVVKEVEVDVGYGVQNRDVISLVVVDSDILPTSKIVATQSGTAATGKTADENELDQFIVTVNPSSTGGSATFILTPLHHTTLTGKYKIHYVIG